MSCDQSKQKINWPPANFKVMVGSEMEIETYGTMGGAGRLEGGKLVINKG
jgi:hypothetical protein